MEPYTGAVALIRHPSVEEKLWLVKFNRSRNEFELVMSERLEDESFREGLSREIAWALNLQRNQDFLISNVARLHIEEAMKFPGDSDPRWYVLEFFVVDLYGSEAEQAIQHNDSVQWVSSQEIHSGMTQSGQRIHPQQAELIRKFDLIPAHN